MGINDIRTHVFPSHWLSIQCHQTHSIKSLNWSLKSRNMLYTRKDMFFKALKSRQKNIGTSLSWRKNSELLPLWKHYKQLQHELIEATMQSFTRLPATCRTQSPVNFAFPKKKKRKQRTKRDNYASLYFVSSMESCSYIMRISTK